MRVRSINDDAAGDKMITVTGNETAFEMDNGFIPFQFEGDELTIESDDVGDSGS